MIEDRTITTDEGELTVVVSHPDGDGPFPVVLSFHHGPGLDDGSRQAIQRISDAGYYVISPDRYYRHGKLIVMDMRKMAAPDTDPKERERVQEIFMGTTDDHVERDVQAVLGYLKTDPAARPAPMGCIGYCIGARSVCSAWRDLRRLRGAPVVDVADLVHTANGAVGRAALLGKELPLHVRPAVLGQRHAGIATLLRTVVHQAELADIEIASACAAPPVVGLAVRDRFLEVVEARIAAPRQLADFVPDGTLFLAQRL